MPDEFDRETAMGLFANIPAVEAARSLEIAKGIAIVLGDGGTLAQTVFTMTGSAKLAQRVEIDAFRRKGMRKHG